jgi:predicted DNA-binding ribbon-helix-helix protein
VKFNVQNKYFYETIPMALTPAEKSERHRRALLENGGKKIPVEMDRQTLATLERLASDRNITRRSLIAELIHAEARRVYA